MEFYQISDKGNLRPTNQDNCNIVKSKDDKLLMFVSDGIGGGNAGDVASLVIKNYLSEDFKLREFEDGFSYYDYLKLLINKTNKQVLIKSKTDPKYVGMGATLTGALVTEKKTYIFNVGDSRCYSFKDNEMKCLTTDHTLLNSLIESGLVDKLTASNKYQRNILLNALGIESDLRIDIEVIDNDYDYLLACSDGLYGYVEEEEFKNIVLSLDTVQTKCEKMIDLANSVGGYDNCTVVLLKRGND